MTRPSSPIAFIAMLMALVAHGAAEGRDRDAVSLSDTTPPLPAAAAEVDEAPLRPLVFTPKSYPGIASYNARKLISGSHRSAQTGGSHQRPEVYVLLPPKVALTTEAQPSLFWYLSQPTASKILITINTLDAPKPVLSLQLDGAAVRGIQRLDLSRLGVTLSPKVEYEWVVTLVVNPNRPAENVSGRSIVCRIAPSDCPFQQLAGQTRYERARIFFEEGIFVDALSEICDLIDQQPRNMPLIQIRNDMLQQVNYEVVLNRHDDQSFEERIVLAETGS